MTKDPNREQRQAEVNLGMEAENILGSELVKNSILAVERDLVRRWKTSKPGDAELREQLYHRLSALTSVVKGLRSVIETGSFASTQLAALESADGPGSKGQRRRTR